MALLAPGEVSADEPAKANIIVYICQSVSSPSRPWRNTLSRSISTALARPNGAHVSVRGEAECGAANVEIACNAGVYDAGGAIMSCAPGTLVTLVRAAAWYAIEHDTNPDENYESFRMRHPARLGLAAFNTINGMDPASPLAAQIEGLRQQAEGADDPTTRRTRVFEAIVNLVFAALIGHESSHLETQSPYCAIGSTSRAEDADLWKVLLRIASSDELYKPETPDIGEVRADRCATRRVRFALAGLEQGKVAAEDQDFARRAAADIVSTMLLVHFDSGGNNPQVLINDSYLYTPLRIVALAGELGLGRTGPVICGGAAENLTEAIQFTFKQRPGNGALPDELENLLPKGVVDAWERRAGWSPKSFACN